MEAGYIYDNNKNLIEEGIDLSQYKQVTRAVIDKVNKANYCHGFEGVDLSQFNLSNLSLDDISNITFDQKTKWPVKENLPNGFDPSMLLRKRRRVYPGIQKLHNANINGQGVNVVYIDQQNKYIFNHEEFKHLTYQYFDYNGLDLDSFHPYGVLSNLCGKNTGVAPNINLYYYSGYRWKEYDKATLDCLIDILEKLSKGTHFDVVGISGPLYIKNNNAKTLEQKKIDEIVRQIETFGCVLIDGYRFLDDFTCCGLSANNKCLYENLDYVLWASETDKLKPAFICKGQVIAEWQTTNEYVYQGTNCDSWPIAQCVGLFALCRQVNKEITYKQFVNIVQKSLINNRVIDFQKCIEIVKSDIKENSIKIANHK